MNLKIQETFNPAAPSKKEISHGNSLFRVNDKVMHINNDYNAVKYEHNGTIYIPKKGKGGNADTGVFNGDTGVIYDTMDFYELIVFDMPDTLGLDSPAVKNDVEDMEEFAVEYVYDKPQSISVNNPDIKQVQFIKMIFSLGVKWENQVYIKTKDDLYYFIGYRPDLGALVRSAVN